MRQYLYSLILLHLLFGCARNNDFRDATGPFAPPISTGTDFLMRNGYEPVTGNIDVIALRRKVSDTITFYFQFGEDARNPAEVFISEVILPKDTSAFVQFFDHSDLEIISKVTRIDSQTSAFYLRNHYNHMVFASTLMKTDSTFVLQSNYTMPYLSEIRNMENSGSLEQ